MYTKGPQIDKTEGIRSNAGKKGNQLKIFSTIKIKKLKLAQNLRLILIDLYFFKGNSRSF